MTPLDPLLMNAFNTVNLAGAAILTSTSFAYELGIPQEQWIYALGGAGTRDSDNCECLTTLHVECPLTGLLYSLGATKLPLQSIN